MYILLAGKLGKCLYVSQLSDLRGQGYNNCCLQGWQYIPPLSGSGDCCGQCEQVACVLDGKLYKPGTEWSSDSGCLTHMCSSNFTVSMYAYASV